MQHEVSQRLPTDYGSFWIRFGGWLIDSIIIAAVSGMLAIAGGSTASFLGLAIGIGYYVGLNANGGTLGKRAVGLRLESEKTGEDIGYGAALVRYVVAIASALVFFLGYFWVIWDDKNQTWHDKAAGSVVVRPRTMSTLRRQTEAALRDLDSRKPMQETGRDDSAV